MTYLKEPRPVVTVRQSNAWVSCDDCLVDGENGLRVNANPGNLKKWPHSIILMLQGEAGKGLNHGGPNSHTDIYPPLRRYSAKSTGLKIQTHMEPSRHGPDGVP